MRMLKRIRSGCGEVAKIDVARSVQVAIRSIGTMGTCKHLASTESMVQLAARTACLARIGFVNNLDVTPWIGSSVVQQARAEPKVRPCGHGPRRLAVDSTPAVVLSDHALCLELGQQHHVVALAQPFDEFALYIVDQIPNLGPNPRCRTSHLPSSPMRNRTLLCASTREVVERVTQTIHAFDIVVAPLDAAPLNGIVACVEGSHAWIECDHGRLLRGDLVLVPRNKR